MLDTSPADFDHEQEHEDDYESNATRKRLQGRESDVKYRFVIEMASLN